MDQDASQLEVHDVDAWSSSSMSNCSSLLLFACLSSLGVSPGLAISVPDGGSVDLKQNQLSGVTVSLTPQPNSLITALELSAQPLQLAQTPIDSSILDSVPNTNIRSEAVAEAQALLAQLGYYDGNIDGIYGVRTEAAVSKFQRDAGLPSDGQINQQTWQRLLATRDQAPPVLPDSSESASALSSEDGQISEAPPTDGPLKTSSEEISEDTTTTSSSNLNGNADPKDDVANRSVSVAADESASQGSEEDSSPETDLATPSSNPLSQRSWLQWLLLLIVGSIIGGGLYPAGRWRGKREKQQGGLFGGRSPLQHSSSHTSSAKSEAISTNSQSATVSKEASNGVTALSPHQSGNGESGNGESGNGESGNRGDDHPVEPGTPSD
ncbi:MAG TPA: peptidoglycan-binding domain-containing protein, partial [Elainellaceae cyanobacterium]